MDRVQRLQALRWDVGAVLPAPLKENLSPHELSFSTKYNRNLSSYMQAVGVDVSADLHPPKELYIQVRHLQRSSFCASARTHCFEAVFVTAMYAKRNRRSELTHTCVCLARDRSDVCKITASSSLKMAPSCSTRTRSIFSGDPTSKP